MGGNPLKGETRGTWGQNTLFLLASGELHYDGHLDFVKHIYFTKGNNKRECVLEHEFSFRLETCGHHRTTVFMIESHQQMGDSSNSFLLAELCVCTHVHVCVHMCTNKIVQLFSNSTTSTMPENLTNELFLSICPCPSATNKACLSIVLFPFSQLTPYKAVKSLLSNNIR